MLIRREYETDLKLDMVIAVASDLHEQDPSEALALLREISPDIILVPGDLFERLTEDFKREFARPGGGSLHTSLKGHILHFMFWCIANTSNLPRFGNPCEIVVIK